MKSTKASYLTAGLVSLTSLSLMFSGCKKDDESKPAVNNDLFRTVTLVTTGGSFSDPSSAVPDATGQFIYFTAVDAAGAGVFKVPATGGTATRVFTGAPFSRPIDLVLSTDNQTIFVADSGAGAILSMNIAGGTPVMVPGTAGTAPVALDVIQRAGQDQIYFCGTNAADRMPSIFEITSAGAGSPIIRFDGSPLTAPVGIVSAKDGTLYIADNAGWVHKLTTTGAISTVAEGIVMGSPAGIALTPDEHALAVSSKTSATGTAQVTVIDLLAGSISIFNKVIGANGSAGGLHVARNAAGATGTYAWADVQRPGHVYRIDP